MSKWLSNSKRSLVISKTNGLCGYCGSVIDSDKCTVDHLVPKIRGGSNQVENLVLACKSCNTSKGSLSVEDYRIWLSWRDLAKSNGFSVNQIKWLLANTNLSSQFNAEKVTFYFEGSEVSAQ